MGENHSDMFYTASCLDKSFSEKLNELVILPRGAAVANIFPVMSGLRKIEYPNMK